MLLKLRDYVEENRYLGIDFKKYIGKTIYAYGADKHRPCCYSHMGVIEKIENNLVYIYDKNNPIDYQHYSMSLDDLLKFEKEKLYKIK